MLPVIEAFTEDIKKVNTLLQLATLTRNILQKLTIKDIQVVTLPDNYFKFKFVTEDGTTIETNAVFIGESISIDDALSLLSPNPVQNKVITAAINEVNGAITSLSGRLDGIDGVLNRLAEIKDAQGNKRFIQGTFTYMPPTGVSVDYAKWSLSGTHLMLVICFHKIAGSLETGGINFDTIGLPQYVLDKINPAIGSYVDTKWFKATKTGYSDSVDVWTYVVKLSNALRVTLGSFQTTGNDDYARIIYDFLIE